MNNPAVCLLLLDVGNTTTHVGLADEACVRRRQDFLTIRWRQGGMNQVLRAFVGRQRLSGAALCSVVPSLNAKIEAMIWRHWNLPTLQLSARTIKGIGLDYPQPHTIGADRLANALAVVREYGAPAVVIDFGTAVTFDVVNQRQCYVGGIIAPGLSAMTTYLHEKTALLPAIKIREIQTVIGKNTREAMLIGAVHGYRGLIRELLRELRCALPGPRPVVIATGGYAELMASRLPEIDRVDPALTLKGVRWCWLACNPVFQASPTCRPAWPNQPIRGRRLRSRTKRG